ncbi:MAG: PDZ domain-containing protein, partial [Saprospiraceae bacterium]|nr:PDZ domain-containing protein [Saprospiraceae bacterium]
ARRSGINKDDIILQIQGQDVKDVQHFKALLSDMPKDKSVPLLIRRDKRSLFVALRPANGESDKDDKR